MTWKAGQSGNPGGRPKVLNEEKELARVHTKAAIDTLVKNLSDENGSIRNQAAIALLDRGYGKPAQTIAGDEDNPLVVERIERVIVDVPHPENTDGAGFSPAT